VVNALIDFLAKLKDFENFNNKIKMKLAFQIFNL